MTDSFLLTKVALITDAASPLGRLLTRALALQGWDLALHYQQFLAPILEMVAECETLGRRAWAICGHLDDAHQVQSLIPRINAEFGAVVCVINSAAYVVADTITDFSAENLDQHMRTNVSVPVMLAQALHASSDAPAVVINILDQQLFHPDPALLSYSLSKAALQKATTTLALALAPRVRVVGIAPALMPGRHAIDPSLGDHTSVADFAASVCFIAGSSAITGTTLLMDGGQHLRIRTNQQCGKVP